MSWTSCLHFDHMALRRISIFYVDQSQKPLVSVFVLAAVARPVIFNGRVGMLVAWTVGKPRNCAWFYYMLDTCLGGQHPVDVYEHFVLLSVFVNIFIILMYIKLAVLSRRRFCGALSKIYLCFMAPPVWFTPYMQYFICRTSRCSGQLSLHSFVRF